MDYRKYEFSKQELVTCVAIFAGISALFSYLFYRSVFAFLLSLPLLRVFLRIRKRDCIQKRQNELARQFLDGMQAVSVALSAGYSVETAFGEALKELRTMYQEQDLIVREFHYIVVQLGMNRSLEELLLGLARRSGIDDIRNFAELFSAAKRTGGNLIAIIRNTVLQVSQKEETKREIDTCLAAKRMEQTVMSVIPCGILLYVQVVSPGFLDSMYHNLPGILVMTACLGIYAAAWLWGRKIVKIEV